ncbi:hypothetical protein Ae406Ps2_2619 [Pseudonocardia sp. Ae406_Ps2]|nr:hypothetical protein Ae331Ps2_3301c [Pseudonocardia sp. Ae331_Ps2]OLM02619.1 hypothetical protein Ae406Ps2_2619 [Pseudonocardia sp. Ae406_Ps2]OLM12538.1 hypothetical protein Ae505Ps2_2666c [Pseudonocardia sp. Ae505_Ps2]OLM24194.1 hypothetical protein Ae706Ps2_2627 [Pseudonocardia sp. Ae706_Ps2]
MPEVARVARAGRASSLLRPGVASSRIVAVALGGSGAPEPAVIAASCAREVDGHRGPVHLLAAAHCLTDAV